MDTLSSTYLFSPHGIFLLQISWQYLAASAGSIILFVNSWSFSELTAYLFDHMYILNSALITGSSRSNLTLDPGRSWLFNQVCTSSWNQKPLQQPLMQECPCNFCTQQVKGNSQLPRYDKIGACKLWALVNWVFAFCITVDLWVHYFLQHF